MNNIADVTAYGFMELNLRKNEKIDDVFQKVKESVRVLLAQQDIDHAHRIGLEYTDKNS